MAKQLTIGTGALIFMIGYIAFSIVIGYIAGKKKLSNTAEDFFLGSRTLGTLVLFFTLYGTQYSGNTIIGYPGKAYRVGFIWLMSVTFMVSVLVGYLLFAPRLRAYADKYKYITPSDFIYHRTESKAVTFLASIFMLYAMSNYVLAQFMAMGHIFEGISGGRIPYAAGVIFFAIIMFILIHLGGFRGVAWTDTVQGITMLFGLLLIIGIAFSKAGSLSEITMKIAQMKPKLVGAPPGKVIATWYSVLILVGIGAAIYPQAIQRIYAARDLKTLKKSLALMAFMPYITTLVVFFVGIICIPMFAGLGKIKSDEVFPMLLSKVMGESAWGYALVVIVLSAVGAAIMSTADSVVLTLASIYAVDVHKKFINPNLTQEELARVGKIANAIILAILTYIAITPKLTLWRLTEIKFEFLIQVAPAILLGVRAKKLNNTGLFLGMLVGGVMAAGMMLSGYSKFHGIHAGLWGLLVNFIIVLIFNAISKPKEDEIRKFEERFEKVLAEVRE